MLSKTFCDLGINGVSIHGEYITPCCRFKPTGYDLPKTIEEYTTNPTIKAIKNQILNSEYPKGCTKCKIIDDSGNMSPRHRGYTDFNSSTDTIKLLEIQFTNLCNLQCLTCGGHSSTSWNVLENALLNSNNIDSFSRYAITTQFYDDMDISTLSDLSYLKLLGGEIFIHPKFEEYLISFSDDQIKNINLEIFTNCTIFPSDAIIEKLHKFKSVKVNLSIDGIGDVFEYIRRGAIWSTVEKNIKKWVAIEKLNFNAVISVSVFNILYLNDIFLWFKDIPNIESFANIVINPSYLQFNVLPQEYILPKIETMKEINLKTYNKLINHNKFSNSGFDTFKNFIGEVDNYKNINMVDFLPELYDIINK